MKSINVDHIKGHSLRIGGATELASKGCSATIIETAGRWVPNSKARLACQRRIGFAAKGLTTTLLN